MNEWTLPSHSETSLPPRLPSGPIGSFCLRRRLPRAARNFRPSGCLRRALSQKGLSGLGVGVGTLVPGPGAQPARRRTCRRGWDKLFKLQPRPGLGVKAGDGRPSVETRCVNGLGIWGAWRRRSLPRKCLGPQSSTPRAPACLSRRVRIRPHSRIPGALLLRFFFPFSPQAPVFESELSGVLVCLASVCTS